MVTHRAREVLAGLEANAASQRTPRKRGPSRGRQLALPLPSPVEEALRRADLARMTPLEALNFLSTLRTLVEQPGEGPPIADTPGATPRPGGRQAGTVVPFPKSPGDPSRR